MDDYRKFCIKCGWNDGDYGCTSPSGEEVYQCPMYMHYHPDEVDEFDKAMEKWAQKEDNFKRQFNPVRTEVEDER